MSKLVILESPGKAKTVQKYLGPNYEVVACMGHIRDLPKSKMGVDIEHDFEPQYIEMKDKKDIIKTLRSKASDADYVYLAGDPDREGEAISWHLCYILGLNENDLNRVTFNEITKKGVEEGISHPRKIDMDLVNAQQARRVLDRIVGYKLSPFLWKKVKRGLSAGRCQSAALKIVVDREKEIRDFKPEEYWSIDAVLTKGRSNIEAHLANGKDGKKIEISNEQEANDILADLNSAEYIVKNVKKGTRKKQPAPPFITSTLQQEASRKLNFNAQRTMRVAQNLYEGVELQGQGATGLITYMRTDSLRISEEARAIGNQFIKDNYGDNYLPEKPRYFKTKKNAQDAHEAIRPTNPALTPASIKDSLTADQYKLYKLIWERFIASLMAACIQNTVSIDIDANGYTFKASGYTVKFDGFTTLYVEGKDEAEETAKAIPELKVDDVLKLKEIKPNQHFTQPPPRFTEASLIKMLEESGIGRPSTFATTVTTIIKREYVERDKKTLIPTKLGEIITDLLSELFPEIVDQKFTAKVESQLDDVESGDEQWKEMLGKFYKGFDKTLKSAEEKMDGTRVKVPEEESDVICEKCGRKMVIRSGRFGKFLACPGFPECKNTKPIVTETKGLCPKCGKKIIERKSGKGYKYFACEGGKECGFMTWDVPTEQNCPKCGKTLFKRRGGLLVCNNEGCDYEVKLERKKKAKDDE
ncbi:MAG: type I DNA topoisomerase [Acutalibacteraceae bacterium]